MLIDSIIRRQSSKTTLILFILYKPNSKKLFQFEKVMNWEALDINEISVAPTEILWIQTILWFYRSTNYPIKDKKLTVQYPQLQMERSELVNFDIFYDILVKPKHFNPSFSYFLQIFLSMKRMLCFRYGVKNKHKQFKK